MSELRPTLEMLVPDEEYLQTVPREDAVQLFREANILAITALVEKGPNSPEACSLDDQAQVIGLYLAKTAK